MNLISRNFNLDDFFEDLLPTANPIMKCDIYEKDGDYHVEVDLPGFDKKDASVEVKDGYLVIQAEKQVEDVAEEKKYIRKERLYGKYQRSFYVGDIEINDIKAKFEQGTLKIMIPKKVKTEAKRLIEIED